MRMLRLLSTVIAFSLTWPCIAADNSTSWPDVQREVQTHLAALEGYQANDIISLADVKPIFSQLQQLGWTVSKQQEIEDALLSDGHFLVQQLRDRRGRSLMRKVSGYPLIYDRLDRISQVDGGKQLIQDLPKLPDAEKAIRYLPDLLPKKVGGRTRTVKDYNKPTGKIYSEKDLLKQLQEAYDADQSTTTQKT